MLLASRGAKLVINDLGGTVDGSGAGSSEMANKVVAEIKAAGGEAVADAHGVDTAAGGRPSSRRRWTPSARSTSDQQRRHPPRQSFMKMEEEDWDKVMAARRGPATSPRPPSRHAREQLRPNHHDDVCRRPVRQLRQPTIPRQRWPSSG
jgi:hypothetical protein